MPCTAHIQQVQFDVLTHVYICEATTIAYKFFVNHCSSEISWDRNGRVTRQVCAYLFKKLPNRLPRQLCQFSIQLVL